jgi:maltose/moltooligosaccharide transporter
MLWIMDASINVSMEPFRAFVGDNLPDNVPWDLPCILGLALTFIKTTVNFTYLGVDNTAPLGIILTQLIPLFCGIAFIVTVLLTVI